MVIGGEKVLAAEVRLGIFVVPPQHRVIGPLKETVLTVGGKLERGAMFIIPEVRQSPRRQHGAGGNVILALQLDRGDKIFSQRERPPKPVPGEADAQILGHQFLLLVLEFLSRLAVDRVHRKEPPPIALPFRLVKPLDRENEISDVHGDSAQPLVVLVRVCATGSQQLDHRAERSALIQNTAAAFHIRRILKPVREAPL